MKKGDIISAVEYSTEAVNYLEKIGTIPLMRSEEIFFNHYRILKAARDSQDEAKRYLDLAHKILQHKANSLENESYKQHIFRTSTIKPKNNLRDKQRLSRSIVISHIQEMLLYGRSDLLYVGTYQPSKRRLM
jgi:hypothetical protein